METIHIIITLIQLLNNTSIAYNFVNQGSNSLKIFRQSLCSLLSQIIIKESLSDGRQETLALLKMSTSWERERQRSPMNTPL